MGVEFTGVEPSDDARFTYTNDEVTNEGFFWDGTLYQNSENIWTHDFSNMNITGTQFGFTVPDWGDDYRLTNVWFDVPGLSFDEPLLPYDFPSIPADPDNPFPFVFPSFHAEAGTSYFFDPYYAVGYDYEVTGGQLFTSVTLPLSSGGDPIGDNLYDIYYDWNSSTSQFESVESNWSADTPFVFPIPTGPVDKFRVAGIETSAGLDPTDDGAFVTELTFSGEGEAHVTQTPISQHAPEPATWLLIGTGIFGVIGSRLRRRKKLKTEKFWGTSYNPPVK